jgi:hypothetical protein
MLFVSINLGTCKNYSSTSLQTSAQSNKLLGVIHDKSSNIPFYIDTKPSVSEVYVNLVSDDNVAFDYVLTLTFEKIK